MTLAGSHLKILKIMYLVSQKDLAEVPISFSKSKLGYSSLMLLTPVSWHKDTKIKVSSTGTSLAVQWLHASSAGGMGLISGQGTKIPHATWPKKHIKSYKSFLWKLWKEKVNSRQSQFIIMRVEDMFMSLSSGSQWSMDGGGYLQETFGKVRRKFWLLQLRGATDTC